MQTQVLWSSHFICVYLYAQTEVEVDAGRIGSWQPQLFQIMGKTLRLPFWVPCQDENGVGSHTASPLYTCEQDTHSNLK